MYLSKLTCHQWAAVGAEAEAGVTQWEPFVAVVVLVAEGGGALTKPICTLSTEEVV